MNYLGWYVYGADVIRYEDLVQSVRDVNGAASKLFFERLLRLVDVDLPEDCRDRVSAGGSPELSWTYSNLEDGEDKYPSRGLVEKLVEANCAAVYELLSRMPER
jgi:hypothetical protein